MDDIETRGEAEGMGTRWGFLEDMESIGRLDMVVGDGEESVAETKDLPPEDSAQE